MRLKAMLAGLVLAAAVAVGGSTASAQSQTNQKSTVKKTVKKQTIVVVNQGDTLSSIATQYKTTYQRLYDANTSVDNPDLIYPGEQIRVPDATEQIAHRDLPVAVSAPVETAPAAPAQSLQPVAAPAPAAPAQSASVVQAAATTSPSTSGCGDNQYANYIYMHESGCRTTAMSSNGCYGIGQACPASKIAYCGADYACQNAWFTNYAARYGGWAGAYDHWIKYGWW